MANPSVWNTDTERGNKIASIGTSALYNNSVSSNRGVKYHKSLDFSNVGIPLDGDTAGNGGAFRQYHQTRIYINNFSGMYRHGSKAPSNTDTYLISANLPENIGYSFGSKWSAPLSSFGGANTNLLMQVVGSKWGINSGINRVTTMKIWDGTEPLSLSLRIPVIDDGYGTDNNQTGLRTNLVEALEFLGSLSLPSEAGRFGFYTPPPSPLNLSIKYKNIFREGDQQQGAVDKTIDLHPTTARIMLQLGGILLVDNCIIESVRVDYPNTKTMIRHSYKNVSEIGMGGTDYLTPLLAFVTINITTIEALTADHFSKMLWLKPNEEAGSMNANFAELQDKAGSAVEGFISGASNLLSKF